MIANKLSSFKPKTNRGILTARGTYAKRIRAIPTSEKTLITSASPLAWHLPSSLKLGAVSIAQEGSKLLCTHPVFFPLPREIKKPPDHPKGKIKLKLRFR